MLVEAQFAAWPKDPAKLGERGVLVRYRTQDQRGDGRVK